MQSRIAPFHTDTKGTVQFNGSSSEPFEIRSGVKQGCVLAPTLFGIFFGLLLKHAFDTTTEGIYLRARSDGRLFNLARLRAKTKVRKVLIRDMLFADDAAVATHTQEELQSLMDCFSQACKDFGLTISLKKTNVMGQDTEALPVITIDNYELDAVCQFTYLGSTITDNLSLDAEIDKRIGKAASTLARLTARVWTSPKLSVKTNMAVYNACVISTLMYGSETWTTYAGQERRLNSFHMRSIRRILGISWQDKVSNADVLSRAGLPTMYTLLRQRRLRWLGHVRRMEDGRIPKDILYGELALGRRTTGRPHLRYKDVCARDRKAVGIDTMSWEGLQLVVQGGGVPWSNTSRQGKTNWWLQQRTSEHAERRTAATSDPQPHTYVLSATKTATPTLVFSAISDAVTTQQQINKIKKQTLGCIIHGHLWPTEASMMILGQYYDLSNMLLT